MSQDTTLGRLEDSDGAPGSRHLVRQLQGLKIVLWHQQSKRGSLVPPGWSRNVGTVVHAALGGVDSGTYSVVVATPTLLLVPVAPVIGMRHWCD
jgi:hypothetical protein